MLKAGEPKLKQAYIKEIYYERLHPYKIDTLPRFTNFLMVVKSASIGFLQMVKWLMMLQSYSFYQG